MNFNRIIKAIIIFFEKISPYYLSVTKRVKSFSKTTFLKYEIFEQIGEEYAIVMQGPIVTRDNFTLETLKLYRYVYPKITIVLSTWPIADENTVQQLTRLRIIIKENKPPVFAGAANVNFQITSTAGGLHSLNKAHTKYVLKTRADQRCCKPVDFLGYMRMLQEWLPLKHSSILNERLIIVSLNNFLRRLYGITDMFMFGTLNDMLLYWDVPLQETIPDWQVQEPAMMIMNNIGEGYFVNQFFNKLNFSPEWNVLDSDMFLAKYFCIIDKEQVDLFWLKYNRYFESIEYPEPSVYNNWIRRDFLHWACTYRNNNY